VTGSQPLGPNSVGVAGAVAEIVGTRGQRARLSWPCVALFDCSPRLIRGPSETRGEEYDQTTEAGENGCKPADCC
jgi:hypothetical protein